MRRRNIDRIPSTQGLEEDNHDLEKRTTGRSESKKLHDRGHFDPIFRKNYYVEKHGAIYQKELEITSSTVGEVLTGVTSTSDSNPENPYEWKYFKDVFKNLRDRVFPPRKRLRGGGLPPDSHLSSDVGRRDNELQKLLERATSKTVMEETELREFASDPSFLIQDGWKYNDDKTSTTIIKETESGGEFALDPSLLTSDGWSHHSQPKLIHKEVQIDGKKNEPKISPKSFTRGTFIKIIIAIIIVSPIVVLFSRRLLDRSSHNQGPLKVSVFYASICIDSVNFITKELAPNYNELAENIFVDFIPYGKATHEFVNGSWKFECQHGEDECYGNMMQACGLKEIHDQATKVKFINCVMSARYPPSNSTMEKCANTNGISWENMVTCSKNGVGAELLAAYGDRTHNVKPKITFIPTIIYNDVYDTDLQTTSLKSFLKTVTYLL